METFNEKLKRLMEEKNMSQKALAKKLGISASSVSKYLTGDRFPKPRRLIEISRIFGVSVDELLLNTKRTSNDILLWLFKERFKELSENDQKKIVKILLNGYKK